MTPTPMNTDEYRIQMIERQKEDMREDTKRAIKQADNALRNIAKVKLQISNASEAIEILHYAIEEMIQLLDEIDKYKG